MTRRAYVVHAFETCMRTSSRYASHNQQNNALKSGTSRTDQAGNIMTVLRLIAFTLLVGSMSAGPATAGASQVLRPLVEALAQKGYAEDLPYRTVAGVPSPERRTPTSGTEPDEVLRKLGTCTRETIQALTLRARKEDAACARGVQHGGTGGTSIGPRNFSISLRQRRHTGFRSRSWSYRMRREARFCVSTRI